MTRLVQPTRQWECPRCHTTDRRKRGERRFYAGQPTICLDCRHLAHVIADRALHELRRAHDVEYRQIVEQLHANWTETEA